MRNTFVLDNTLENKTLTKLDNICYAKIRIKHIQTMLQRELDKNEKVIEYIKERNNV